MDNYLPMRGNTDVKYNRLVAVKNIHVHGVFNQLDTCKTEFVCRNPPALLNIPYLRLLSKTLNSVIVALRLHTELF